jgi:hypothetical protein
MAMTADPQLVSVQVPFECSGQPGPPSDAGCLVDAGAPLHRVGRQRAGGLRAGDGHAGYPSGGWVWHPALRETLAAPRVWPERLPQLFAPNASFALEFLR